MLSTRVTLKLDNLKRLQKVTKVNLSYPLAKEFAKTLSTVITQRASISTGELAESVKARKVGRYGSGVYAAYYFWYANYGRRAGKSPPAGHPRLQNWAAKAGWDENTLRGNIGKYGTKPTHFFEAAKQIFAVKKKRAYKKILKGK
jgi:hypothetical protein